MSKIKIHPWPLGIILFFLVVVSVNSYLVYLSINYPATATVGDAYSESLQYDQQMQAIENGKTLGFVPEIQIGKDETEVIFHTQETAADEITPRPIFSALHLELKNFADPSFDRVVKLSPNSDGKFLAENTGQSELRPGKWEFTIKAKDTPGLSYLWKKNVHIITGEDSSSILFP